MQNHKPEIIAIAAVSKNYVIGQNNKMPWHLPADLKFFKNQTKSHCVIMGSNTYKSLGKALPNRDNAVISRKNLIINDAKVFSDIKQAIEYYSYHQKIFIIGGGQIFNNVIDMCDTLLITWIDSEIIGDCYFPKFNLANWQLINQSIHKKDDKNAFNLHFCRYEKFSKIAKL